MRNLNVLVLSILVLSILSLSSVSAFFPQSHIAWTVDGFNTIKSPITDNCRQYLNVVLDGDNGADSGVLHYGGSLVTSYIYTHTLAGYKQCLIDAADEVDKQCFCHGMYLHIIQDSFSHNTNGNLDGVVVAGLKQYAGSNYFGHMTLERDFENKHVEQMKKNGDYAITSGSLDKYNAIYLDTLLTSDGKPSKYLAVINDIAGIDLSGDVKAIRSGYQGVGFYDSNAKNRYSLPAWAILIIIALLTVGLGMVILNLLYGSGGWKWISVLFWVVILSIGVIILISFFTGGFWSLITKTLDTTAATGYLSVSDKNVALYSKVVQDATNNFLQTGDTPIQDASGLSYCPKGEATATGCNVKLVGYLDKAETPFKVVYYGVFMPLSIAIMVFLNYKSFKKKNGKKKK